MTCPLKVIPHNSWRTILRKNFTNLALLADFLELNEYQKSELLHDSKFILQVPLRLAQKMKKGTLEDPIFKQFVPLKCEQNIQPDFSLDPVCDATFRKGKKLLKKYQGRALILSTSACAMHCRFCFRQNFDYHHQNTFEEETAFIRHDININEVILSGGDPLSLSNEVLAQLLVKLGEIPHLKRIRFHSRFVIGIPERIDEEFLDILCNLPQQIYFVIHCNHPNELDDDVISCVKKLQLQGVIVLNQAVLLKGVNDDEPTLYELSQTLGDNGILFYYLHQLDKLQGAAHFEVDENKGRALIEAITKRLSGYVVPKFVREIAGEASKTPI